MGIASTYDPYDTYSNLEVDPEVTNQTVIDVVAYLKTLKAPVQRTPDDAAVVAGKRSLRRSVAANATCPK